MEMLAPPGQAESCFYDQVKEKHTLSNNSFLNAPKPLFIALAQPPGV